MSKTKVIILVLWILLLSFNPVLFSREKADTGKLRNFMLVFDVKEYTSHVKSAVTYFINDVLQEGDQLIIVSPKKLVGFSLAKLSGPKDKLIKEIVKMLKEDINRGMARYRDTIKEMMQSALFLSGERGIPSASDLPSILATYQQNRQILVSLRGNLEERLMKFNKIFRHAKADNRENHLLMISEKESRPIPEKKIIDQIRQSSFEYGMRAVEVFLMEKHKTELDFQKIQKAFKYAGVKFHFLYLQGKSGRFRRGIEYIDNSGDVYDAFSKLAKNTGGLQMSGSRPTSFFKKVDQLKKGKVVVEVIDQTMKKEDEK